MGDNHVVVPVMPPFQPSRNSEHADLLYSYFSSTDGHTDGEFHFTDSFWSVFCQEISLCPDAMSDPLSEVDIGNKRVTANSKWVKSYIRSLEAQYPHMVTVVPPAGSPVSFQANDEFWEKCKSLKGTSDDGPTLEVQSVSLDQRVTYPRININVSAWTELVEEWNKRQRPVPVSALKKPLSAAGSFYGSPSGRGSKRFGRTSEQGLSSPMLGSDLLDDLYMYAEEPPAPPEPTSCCCVNHSPMRLRESLGMQLASVFQAQRKLHYSLLNQDAASAEKAIEDLDQLNASEKVVDLLLVTFPKVPRGTLHTQRDFYLNQILENPRVRGRAGSRKPLPLSWPSFGS
eukprot:TRINITY_DN19908_c0_g1_i1.p1 TRINITY_DN19908_c0_g1~~TRINITY_DN19908_c0_g1_i1.p1  ORF type:complete len:343 (+),score=48.35 TRINITY_DN19908_c0_g1_i1:43-1071(+)